MQDKLWHITKVSEFDELVSLHTLVLIDFYTTWCGPCRVLAPVFTEVAEAHSDYLAAAKIDVDKASELATRFRIRGVPTLALIHNGSLVDTLVGTHSRASIENWLALNTKLACSAVKPSLQ